MNDENTEYDQGNDPHAPKYQPDDERLKIQQARTTSPRMKVIWVSVAVVVGLGFIAAVTGYIKQANDVAARSNSGEKEEEVVVNPLSLPPAIQQLPEVPPPPPAPPIPEHMLGTSDSAMSQEDMDYEEEEDKAAAAKNITLYSPQAAGFGNLQMAEGNGMDKNRALLEEMKDQQKAALEGLSGKGEMSGMGGSDQNNQGRKNDFLTGAGERSKNYLAHGMIPPASPYEVKAGSIIPASLITGINSDLPGEVIAQVRENVYDTVSGNYLLIPQGSRLLATYDSMISYGQERVLLCWNRLIRPDGTSINLECAPGTDLAGYSGFADKVDNHYGKLIGGVVLSSLLSVGASSSQGQNLGDNTTVDQLFAMNVGQNLNNAGQQITQKNLNIQPTIEIRPGFSVNVLVNKDMIIPPYALD